MSWWEIFLMIIGAFTLVWVASGVILLVLMGLFIGVLKALEVCKKYMAATPPEGKP